MKVVYAVLAISNAMVFISKLPNHDWIALGCSVAMIGLLIFD